jgi:hypothetical protein
VNEAHRRSEAAKRRKSDGADTIRVAYAFVAGSNDPTLAGATLITPDDEIVYIAAADKARLRAGRT